MSSLSTLLLLSICLHLTTSDYQPLWGSIGCNESITDNFPSSATRYYRYYRLNASYPTSIPRDIKISTCIPYLWPTNADIEIYDSLIFALKSASYYPPITEYCTPNERGEINTFMNVAEGLYDIGIRESANNAPGGNYKLSVECIDPPTPPPSEPVQNVAPFPYDTEWVNKSSKKISCGVSTKASIGSNTYKSGSFSWNEWDFYQYTVTEYAQELQFTTCPYGITGATHYIYLFYWNTTSSSWDNINVGWSGCQTLSVEGEMRVSPGTYYVGIDYQDLVESEEKEYVLTMNCWRNAAVSQAIAGVDYTQYTYTSAPSISPITSIPTISKPPTPAIYDMTTLLSDNANNTYYMGPIACGIHQHKTFNSTENRPTNTQYYTFEVTNALSFYSFDTCMDDVTQIIVCSQIFKLDNGAWTRVYPSENAFCSRCTAWNRPFTLETGLYAIAVYSWDSGEYILRMGCFPNEYDRVRPVTITMDPTPSPTPSPTKAPSNPTANPSRNPSETPTKHPSTDPTLTPSNIPTWSPTTAAPTMAGICIWGQDVDIINTNNGWYAYDEEFNGKGSYVNTKPRCGTNSNGINDVYYIWWDSNNNANEWRITTSGRYTILGTDAMCSESELSECSKGKWDDSNIYIESGSCPQWECDTIITTIDTLSSSITGCNGPFTNHIEPNVWSNADESRYFYFMQRDYRWVCYDKYYLRDCSSQTLARSDKGWIDLEDGQFINMNFNYRETGQQQETSDTIIIMCGISTAAPTAPTTPSPTEVTLAPTAPTASITKTNTNTTNSNNNDSNNNDGDDQKIDKNKKMLVIIAVVIGVLILIAIFVIIGACCYRKRQSLRDNTYHKMMEEDSKL